MFSSEDNRKVEESVMKSGSASDGTVAVGAGGMDVWSALINLGSTIAGYIGARKNLKRQAKYNKELAELEFAQNYKMWKENNAYNSPASQMARLKAAGLNPAIIYGGSSGSATGNSDQTPKLDYAGAQLASYVDPASSMAAGTGMMGAYLQAKLNRASIDNLEASAEKARADASRIGVDKLIALEKLPYVGQQIKAEIGKDLAYTSQAYAKADEAYQHMSEMAANIDLTKANAAAVRLSLEIQSLAKDDIVESYSIKNKEMMQNIRESNKRMAKYDQEIANLKEEWFKIQAETYKAFTEGDLNVLQKPAVAKAAQKIDTEIREISARAGVEEKDGKYYFFNHVVKPVGGALVSSGSKLVGAGILKGLIAF